MKIDTGPDLQLSTSAVIPYSHTRPTADGLYTARRGHDRAQRYLIAMAALERSTDRLILRRVAEGDLDAFVALESSLRALEVPPRDPPEVEESARYLTDFVSVWEQGELGYWTVVFDGEIAGFGGVQPRRGGSCWNLYYRVVPTLWGRGIATEVAREAIAAGASAHPDWPVLAETRPWNTSAIKVAKRVGLRRQPADTDDGYAVFLSTPVR